MINYRNRLTIEHISIGFKEICKDHNFADLHKSLQPFGLKWGRGILIKGDNYIEAITGTFGITHSILKEGLKGNEHTSGAFYYGYVKDTRTLYFEYASDANFDFHDKIILDAIMDSLQRENGPLKDFKLQTK